MNLRYARTRVNTALCSRRAPARRPPCVVPARRRHGLDRVPICGEIFQSEYPTGILAPAETITRLYLRRSVVSAPRRQSVGHPSAMTFPDGRVMAEGCPTDCLRGAETTDRLRYRRVIVSAGARIPVGYSD